MSCKLTVKFTDQRFGISTDVSYDWNPILRDEITIQDIPPSVNNLYIFGYCSQKLLPALMFIKYDECEFETHGIDRSFKIDIHIPYKKKLFIL